MTISTERLKERIDRLRKQAADVKWVSTHAAQEMMEVADALAELLAAREAQSVPIGCIKTICGNKTLRWWRDAPEGAEVFTAPPAPAVPAEMTADQMYQLLMEKGGVMSPVDAAVFAWNACRTSAMKNTPQAASQLDPSVDNGIMQNTPAGFKLVPVEPTPEMIAATEIDGDEYYFESDEAAETWMANKFKAMLAAAPTPTKINIPEQIKDHKFNSGDKADDYHAGYQSGWNEYRDAIISAMNSAENGDVSKD